MERRSPRPLWSLFVAAAALLIPVSTFLVGAGWAAAMFGGSGAIDVGFTVGLVASVFGLLSTGLLWLGISHFRRTERGFADLL